MLALSGGADSTAMACMLKILSNKLNITLAATSINHGLREDALEDIMFVRELCAAIEIPCTTHTIDVKSYRQKRHCGEEEAARILRYACLEDERISSGADYVAIAHNADDLNEDVLMRLTRGTGWPSLGGMPIIDAQRKLIRPLLFLDRNSIESFLQQIGIPWKNDATNGSMDYTRNRFRKKITPLLKVENPQFGKNIQNLWQMANIDRDFWEDYLSEALEKDPWEINNNDESIKLCLPQKLLCNVPQAARLRLILKAIKKISQTTNNISAEKIFAIEKAWKQGKGGKIMQLSACLNATIRRHSIHIVNKDYKGYQ